MATNFERRIEALEERCRGRKSRIAVIHQREDGTWPPDPADAALIVAIRRMGAPDLADLPTEAL
jgi:hypothetical protein